MPESRDHLEISEERPHHETQRVRCSQQSLAVRCHPPAQDDAQCFSQFYCLTWYCHTGHRRCQDMACGLTHLRLLLLSTEIISQARKMNREGQDPEPPGPGPGGDAHFLEDAIVLEPDNNNQQAIPDNTAPGVEGAGSSVAVVNIGVPLPDFNIHDSVFYSHHYFEKVRGEDGKTTFKAKCLICWKEKKEETIIKTTDNSTKGLMVHLQTHNEKYVKKLLSQRDHVDGLKKKAKEMRKKSFDGTKQMK